MKDVILAIDGGGSRTRCLAVTRNGEVAGAGESGASNHLLVDATTVRSSISRAIEAALSDGNLEASDVVLVSAGLAGVDYDGVGSSEMEDVFRRFGFENLAVNGDMVIAHAGALSGESGVLALAGTGSSILGVGRNGVRVKVGGWGPIFGDEGSAYGIARDCLRAAARCFDGRAGETRLLDVITRALALNDFSESVKRIYVERIETREIASLCRNAYEIAESGDSTAVEIFRRAGEELAESVAAALRRLDGGNGSAKVSYQGSVIESCAIVRDRFAEALAEEFPKVEVVRPRFKPVVGAFLIGCKAVGWGLDERAVEKLASIGTEHE
jgi:glucosamine kinase